MHSHACHSYIFITHTTTAQHDFTVTTLELLIVFTQYTLFIVIGYILLLLKSQSVTYDMLLGLWPALYMFTKHVPTASLSTALTSFLIYSSHMALLIVQHHIQYYHMDTPKSVQLRNSYFAHLTT